MAFGMLDFPYQGNSQDMKKVQNYLYMLNEQLRYALSNISFSDMTQDTQDDFSEYFQLTYKNDGQLTQFRVDVDGISATVKQNYDDLSSSISTVRQTATEISQTVARQYGELTTDISSIRQTASEISSTVQKNYNALSSSISEVRQTATEISQTVTNNYNSITTEMSEVRQTANKISWLVASGTSSSNFTLTSRMASLVASQIDLTGYVTFNSLSQSGRTTINGDNITTGHIDLLRITARGKNLITYTTGAYSTTLHFGYDGLSSDYTDSLYIYGENITVGKNSNAKTTIGVSGSSLGFYGATPVSKQSIAALSSSASADDVRQKVINIITAMKRYGLF